MKKIVLIAISQKTKKHPTTVENMYSESRLFRASYEYGKMVGDKVYILSPKHGILEGNEIIESDDEGIEDKSVIWCKKWGEKVITQLKENVDIMKDCFEILADKKYYSFIIKELKYYKLPLKLVEKELWIPHLNKMILEEKNRFYQVGTQLWSAQELHKMCQSIPKYDYLSIDKIPFDDGVYLMVDLKEELYECPRIVRVGTHQGAGRLKGRLKQHVFREDRDGSNLRKYIGSALLNSKQDEYISIWEANLRDKRQLRVFKNQIDIKKEKEIEKEVSNYLRERMAVYCINMHEWEKRMIFKENLIRCLYGDETFKPSTIWLGNQSNKLHIATYGLWNAELKKSKEREKCEY